MSAQPTSGGGRPTIYKNAKGERVPGVTTISGKYKDPGGLLHWAWMCGIEGKDYRETRDEAASAGHIVHGWIEDDIHGRAPRKVTLEGVTTMVTVERAQVGFQAFRDWREMVRLEVLDTERPLISELHQIGGTYDALALVSGVPMLLDWKSGNGVYPEAIAQLSAYRQLIREACGNKRDAAPEAACCLRVGKEFGDFHYHSFPREVLDLGWSRFLACKQMYDVDKSLTKVCQ